ncbi:MAG: NUDIX domain-containing protein, partial [Thermoanaerobaculia bacterium]
MRRVIEIHDPPRRALLLALQSHAPADPEEERDRALLISLVSTVERCFDRGTYAPGHVTGSAFVICRQTRQVLLHHHRRLDRWLQLGGHDDGELDPKMTALREAGEESGLTDLELLSPDILDVDVHLIPPSRGEPQHRHHDVRYALETKQPDAIKRQDAESLALAWFDLDEAARRMGE